MKSFFRKLTWLARRPIKEADLQEELQFHLEEEAESQIALGRSAADARLAAAAIWATSPACRRDARGVGLDAAGASAAGHPLRPAHHGRQQGLQRARRSLAGFGHRRQYRHFQLYGRHPAAVAAGGASGTAGDLELAYQRKRKPWLKSPR